MKLGDKLGWSIVIVTLLVVAILYIYFWVVPAISPSPTPTIVPTTTSPSEIKFEPRIVNFPSSWEEDENGYLTELTGKEGIIRITVVEIKALGSSLEEVGLSGVKASEGYQFYGVHVIFKSLMHKEWSCPYGVYVGTLLELVTDKGNIYRVKWSSERVTELKPEEEKHTWACFEIRTDEKPLELRHYDIINPNAPPEKQKLDIVYIWKL